MKTKKIQSSKLCSALCSTAMVLGFVLNMSQALAADYTYAYSGAYDYVDPNKVIERDALVEALGFYEENIDMIENKNVITIVDFSKHSGSRRFHIINMKSGDVQSFLVAHGRGSDKNKTGYAQTFSNIENSNMSSLGPYITGETYYGAHGLSLRLDGFSDRFNSNVRKRNIVVHSAEYVSDQRIQNIGHSHGCTALPVADIKKVISLIKGGSLLYVWSSDLIAD